MVRDTGVGMPCEELPRMFERFHRIERSRGRTHEGTGIGLAPVQELVKLHGGTISVASELGEGTTFTVTIPLGKAHLDPACIGRVPSLASTAVTYVAFLEEAHRWQPDKAASGDAIDGRVSTSEGSRTMTDPKPRNPALLRPTTTRICVHMSPGCWGDASSCKRCATARQPLKRPAADPPALILSDVMMPKLHGLGLLRALRSDPQLCEIP
jgi:CheY-like chemotaxis protein